MEELKLKEAIITPDNKIKCPICYKTNGKVTGEETVRNFKIRCRGSKRNHEHYFMLNLNVEKENK